jgi:hypothetical protein
MRRYFTPVRIDFPGAFSLAASRFFRGILFLQNLRRKGSFLSPYFLILPVLRLREQLAGTLPGELLQHLSNHFDVIGDIAILTLPPELLPYKLLIAAAIITNRRNIYTASTKP